MQFKTLTFSKKCKYSSQIQFILNHSNLRENQVEKEFFITRKEKYSLLYLHGDIHRRNERRKKLKEKNESN